MLLISSGLAPPFRFQRSDVDDQSAACVGALAHADHHDVAGDVHPLDGFGQCETVGRNDHVIPAGLLGVHGDEEIIRERLRVDDRDSTAGGVREDLEPSSHPHVVPVTGNAVRNGIRSVFAGAEGLDPDQFLDL